MKDISEEAKQAVANGALARARQRLVNDGSQTNAAMRRRVLLLAAERNLPAAEYAKLMHKRVLTGPMLAFCKKHDVSMDWLMDGDLTGPAAHEGMEKGRHEHQQRAEILRLLLLLPLEVQMIAIHRLRQMTEGLPHA